MAGVFDPAVDVVPSRQGLLGAQPSQLDSGLEPLSAGADNRINPEIGSSGLHDGQGLSWKTHRTERFLIHYPVSAGAAEDPQAVNGGRVAMRVGTYAEQLYEAYQKALNVSPALPIHIVVDAQLSIARSRAIPEWQRIEISSHPGPFFFFRERGDWLQESIAHELAHLFLNDAGSAVPPGLAFELKARIGDRAWLSRLSGSTPPGNPELTFGGTVPLVDSAPHFWLEGGAEYLAGQVSAHRWDAQRDMLLRMSSLQDLTLSSSTQLSALGQRGLDGERAYNQGYAFLTFLKERYGEEAFVRLLNTASKRPRLNWVDVFDEGQGISYELLNSRFREWLSTRYPAPAPTREFVVGEPLDMAVRPWRSPDQDVRRRWMALPTDTRRGQREAGGLYQMYPRWSPDGKMLAWWNQGLNVQAMAEDQWSAYGGRALNPVSDRLELARRDARVGSVKGLPSYAAAWSPDSKRMVVVADARWRPLGGASSVSRPWTALFVMNVSEGASGTVKVQPAVPGQPLPGTLQAQDPAWSPDGNWIAFVKYQDGTANLWVVRPDGSDARALTGFKDGTDIAHPAWSPDSHRLVFEMYRQNQRDLWILDVEQLSLEPVMLDTSIDLQPSWAADGSIYYSSDISGNFNVYAYDPSTLEVRQVTDVEGGAFMPCLTPGGNLTYSYFDGYAVRLYGLTATQFTGRPVDNANFSVDPTLARSVLLGAHEAPSADGRPYRPLVGLPRLQLTPELVFTEQAVSAGAELSFVDPLERHRVALELLAGQGLLFDARYAWARRGGAFTLEGLTGRDARAVGLYTGAGDNFTEYERRREQHLVAGVVGGHVFPGEHLALGLRLDARHLTFQEREDGASSRPLYAGVGGGPYLSFSTFSNGAVHGAQGVDPRGGFQADLQYQLRYSSAWDPYTQGLVSDSGAVLPSGLYHRLDVALHQAVAAPWSTRQTLDWRLSLGYVNRNVPWWDELKAGSMLAPISPTLDPVVLFPGFSTGSLSGETLGILSLAWRTPLQERMGKALGPLYFDALYLQLGANMGNVWGYRAIDGVSVRETPLTSGASRNQVDASSPTLLTELGAELRVTASVFTRYRWNSFLHLGFVPESVTGLGDINHDNRYPGAYGDLLPEAGGEVYPAGLRIGLGLGTGF